MKKKLIAKLLVLAMVLSIVPIAFAADGDTPTEGSGSNAAEEQNTPKTPDNPYYTVKLDSSVNTGNNAGDITTTNSSNTNVGDNGETNINVDVDSKGNANVNVSEDIINSMAEQTTGDEMVITIKSVGATKVDTALPGKALASAAEKNGASLTLATSVATITIPNEAIVSQFKDVGTVKITAQATGSSVGFSIAASGRALQAIQGLKVEF